MRTCVLLSRAETHCSALDWFDVPIVELSDWIDAINDLEKKRTRGNKK